MLVLVNQFVFNALQLYQRWWWFDIPMHIIGGFLVGLGTIYLVNVLQKEGTLKAPRWLIAIAVITMVAFAAVVWEWYEWLLMAFFHAPVQTWPDTLKDLFDGILGGIVSTLLIKSRK